MLNPDQWATSFGVVGTLQPLDLLIGLDHRCFGIILSVPGFARVLRRLRTGIYFCFVLFQLQLVRLACRAMQLVVIESTCNLV